MKLEQQPNHRPQSDTRESGSLQADASPYGKRLKTLHLLSIQLAKMATFDDLCRGVVELGRSQLGFDRIGLWFTQGDSAFGSFGTDEQGRTRDERRTVRPIHPDEPLYQALQGDPNPLVQDKIILRDDLLNPVGEGWLVIAFLTDGQSNFGYISVDNLMSRRALEPDDIEILALYGVTVGHLTNRKRAEDALRQREEAAHEFQDHLRTLSDVTIALSRVTSFDALCHKAVELGHTQLGFERLGLWFYEDDSEKMLVGSFGIDETGRIRDERHQRIEFSFPDMRAILDGRVIISENTEHPLYDDIGGIVGHGQLASAAVWDGDITIGWLSTDNLLTQKGFTQFRLELLTLFASVIGHFATRYRMQEESLRLAVNMAVTKERVNLLHQFITSISHDFRTPLSIINSSLYFIQRSDDPQIRAERANIITRQTAQLEKYIDDLLTISRLEVLETLPLSRMDLNAILDDLHAKVQRPAQEKGIRLIFTPSDDPLLVLCDYAELTQAAFQIAQNALEYSPANGTLHAFTGRRENMAVLEIVDTGTGISPKDVQRIFDHFYRADPARNPETGGTGLGLSIVRRVIELHRGYVEVDSEIGQGSTFRILLPLADDVI